MKSKQVCQEYIDRVKSEDDLAKCFLWLYKQVCNVFGVDNNKFQEALDESVGSDALNSFIRWHFPDCDDGLHDCVCNDIFDYTEGKLTTDELLDRFRDYRDDIQQEENKKK